MKSKIKYLVIVFFVCIVIIAMFFIYSSINSTERIVFWEGKPGILGRMSCVAKGGKLERLPRENIEFSEDQLIAEELSEDQYDYFCHYY